MGQKVGLNVGKWEGNELVIGTGARVRHVEEQEAIDGLALLAEGRRCMPLAGVYEQKLVVRGYKVLEQPERRMACPFFATPSGWIPTTHYGRFVEQLGDGSLSRREVKDVTARLRELVAIAGRVAVRNRDMVGVDWWRQAGLSGWPEPVNRTGGLLCPMDWQAVWYWRPMAILPLWKDERMMEGVGYLWHKEVAVAVGGAGTLGSWVRGVTASVRVYRNGGIRTVMMGLDAGGTVEEGVSVVMVMPDRLWETWGVLFRNGVALIPEWGSQVIVDSMLGWSESSMPYFNGGFGSKCHGTAAALMRTVHPRVVAGDRAEGVALCRLLEGLFPLASRYETGRLLRWDASPLPAVAWLGQREWVTWEAIRTGVGWYPLTNEVNAGLYQAAKIVDKMAQQYGLKSVAGVGQDWVEHRARIGAIVARLPVICVGFHTPKGGWRGMHSAVRRERWGGQVTEMGCSVVARYPLEVRCGYWTWARETEWDLEGMGLMPEEPMEWRMSADEMIVEAAVWADTYAQWVAPLMAMADEVDGGASARWQPLSAWEAWLVWFKDCGIAGLLADKGKVQVYGVPVPAAVERAAELEGGLKVEYRRLITEEGRREWGNEWRDLWNYPQVSMRPMMPSHMDRVVSAVALGLVKAYPYQVYEAGKSGIVCGRRLEVPVNWLEGLEVLTDDGLWELVDDWAREEREVEKEMKRLGRRTVCLDWGADEGDGKVIVGLTAKPERAFGVEAGLWVIGKIAVRMSGSWRWWHCPKEGAAEEVEDVGELERKVAEGKAVRLDNWVRGVADVWIEDRRMVRLVEKVKEAKERGWLLNASDWVSKLE